MTELRLTMKTSFLLPLQSLVFSLNASVSVVKAFSTQDAKLSMARPGLTKPTTQGKATEAFRPSTATFLAAKGGFDDSDDMVGREEGEGEGEYSGPVDWDEEWKRVVKNKASQLSAQEGIFTNPKLKLPRSRLLTRHKKE